MFIIGRLTTTDTSDKALATTEQSVYNGFNQLIAVEKDGGVIEYGYFASGLRKSKAVESTKTEFYLDGGNVAAETLTGTSVNGMNNYIYGLGLLARVDTSSVSNYLFNGHNDVVHLTGTDGVATRAYDYDAFANEKAAIAGNSNPFRYCGEYTDYETGYVYLRARYYDSGTGRFVSEDPIRDGTNWYGYCENNPVLFIDPWGLDCYVCATC